MTPSMAVTVLNQLRNGMESLDEIQHLIDDYATVIAQRRRGDEYVLIFQDRTLIEWSVGAWCQGNSWFYLRDSRKLDCGFDLPIWQHTAEYAADKLGVPIDRHYHVYHVVGSSFTESAAQVLIQYHLGDEFFVQDIAGHPGWCIAAYRS